MNAAAVALGRQGIYLYRRAPVSLFALVPPHFAA